MSSNWEEKELNAAVAAYIEMHQKEASKESFIKKHYYIDLSKRFGRTAGAFEYRMQNISYVYSLMGRKWVAGLKPATHVGKRNADIIERLICEVEGIAITNVAAFETEVITYRSQVNFKKPLGVQEPEKSYGPVTNYSRDPKVKAWLLKESNGVCECCNEPAPFITAQNLPYLEIHHLRRLADGGSDTITNAIALCPNCHREMHYSINKIELTQNMYEKVLRLVHE